MPGEQHLQTDLRIGGAVSARKFNAAMRELEIVSRLRAGPGIQITRNRSGMSIQATRQEGRGGGHPGGGSAVPFVLQEHGVYAEHIRCKPLNEPDGNDVVILKEELVRQTIIGETLRRRGVVVLIEAGSVAHTMQSVQARQTSVEFRIEIWNVLPSWETSDIIWALPIAEKYRDTLESSLSNDPLGPASGPVTPEWIEVRGRWWGAQRIMDVTI